MRLTLLAFAVAAVMQTPVQPESDGRSLPQDVLQDVNPVQPYRTVPVTFAAPSRDASYAAFRKQLAAIAARQDRDALRRLTVTEGFFWESADGPHEDAEMSAFDNFASAIALDDDDGHGWDLLGAVADDPTLEEIPEMKGVSCAPAGPIFDERAFENLLRATGTVEADWMVVAAPTTVLATDHVSAAAVERIGTMLIRVLPDTQLFTRPDGSDIPFIKVATPAGKIGYVVVDALWPLDFEQVCYVKQRGAWKITGFFGPGP